MTSLYWILIFIVSALLIIITFKVFRMTFGIEPVLFGEILELESEKRNLAIMVLVSAILFIMASIISFFGGPI